MEWKMLPLGEGTEIDANGKFVRYKKARFSVEGREHTLRISMPDFNAGKTRELVQREVDLIAAASMGGKKG